MRAIAAGLSDVGLQREHNEDSFVVLKEYDLFVVADGMGGHRAGDVASKLATETITEFFRSTANEDVTWPFHFDTNLSRGREPPAHGHPRRQPADLRALDPLARVPRHGDDRRGGDVQPAEAADVHRPRRRLALLPRAERRDPAAHARPLAHQRLPARDARPDRRAARASSPRTSSRARSACRTRSSSTSSTTTRSPGDVYVLCSDGLSGMVRDDEIMTDRELEPATSARRASASSSGRTRAAARTTSPPSSSRSRRPRSSRRARTTETTTKGRRRRRGSRKQATWTTRTTRASPKSRRCRESSRTSRRDPDWSEGQLEGGVTAADSGLRVTRMTTT